MKRASSILFFVGCATVGLQARDEQVRDFQKTVPLAAGGSIHIEHSMGNVNVRTQAKQEVDIRASIRCSAGSVEAAKKCADRIDVLVTASTNDVSVRTRYPEESGGNWFGRGTSFSVNYDILIPESARLDLRNRFGRVDVSGLRAPGSVRNANGSVLLTDGRGAQRVQNSFGPIEVRGNAGDVVIENTNGDVEVGNIGGSVDLRNRFGKVTLTKVGAAIVRNNNGTVDASGVAGSANITNSFGSVLVTDAKGDVTVDNSNGSVEVKSIDGAADLHSSFAPVKFSRVGKRLGVRANNSSVSGDTVGGPAVVETSFGNVDLRGVKGGVRVQATNSTLRIEEAGGEVFAATTFGGVTVDGASGPVTVENQNGSVTVKAIPARSCQPLTLRTTFAPMRVAIPAGLGYTVAARTSFGKISSEPEIAASGALNGDTLNGKIAGGGCELRLNNSNGSIDIMKSPAR